MMQRLENMYDISIERNGSSETKYLKCWGCDYPYLNNEEKKDNSLLPVPVKSDEFNILG